MSRLWDAEGACRGKRPHKCPRYAKSLEGLLRPPARCKSTGDRAFSLLVLAEGLPSLISSPFPPVPGIGRHRQSTRTFCEVLEVTHLWFRMVSLTVHTPLLFPAACVLVWGLCFCISCRLGPSRTCCLSISASVLLCFNFRFSKFRFSHKF